MSLLHNGMVVSEGNGNVLYSDDNHTAIWGKDRLQEYNAYNLLPHLADETIDSDGLTGSVSNDVITVSGTTTGPYFINYFSSSTTVPDWWIPGKDVYLLFDATGTGIRNLFIRILKYDGEGNTSVIADLNRSQTYHIPNDFDGVGLIVRFFIATGRTVNASVRPQILNAMTNAQLTQKVNQEDTFSNPPMLTIIDDDGNPKFYTELLPLIESKGVSISSAVIPYRANTGNQNHMTWEQVVDASCKGAEILNHSWNHLTGAMVAEMTAQEVWLNYQKARNTIESHGCNGGGYLVYAGASGSYAQAQEGAKLSNKCAFVSVGNEINYRSTLNRYAIKRFRVQTDGYDYDADKLKELIDLCLANGGWMVWMIHTSETVWTTLNGLSAISDAIDYAIAQGLPIVSVETGYKTYIE